MRQCSPERAVAGLIPDLGRLRQAAASRAHPRIAAPPVEENGAIRRCSGALVTVAGHRPDVAIDPRHRRRRLCRQPRLQGAGRRRLPAGRLRQPVARPPRRGALGSAGRGRSARPRPARRGDARRIGSAAVMHFAAFAYVGESVTDPEIYYRNNVGGTLALLDAMREAGGRDDGLLLDLRGLRRPARRCRSARRPPRRRSTRTARPSWRSSGRCIGTAQRLRPALRRAALFQRRRRRSRRRDRRGPRSRDPSDPARAARRARPRRAAVEIYRHRLSDAGRHRDPRLHPCDRSRRRACPGAWRYLAAGGDSVRAQSRHRQRPFGARGDRGGRARHRPRRCRGARRRAGPATRPSSSPIRRSPASGSAGSRSIPISTRSSAPRWPGRPGAAIRRADAAIDATLPDPATRFIFLDRQ